MMTRRKFEGYGIRIKEDHHQGYNATSNVVDRARGFPLELRGRFGLIFLSFNLHALSSSKVMTITSREFHRQHRDTQRDATPADVRQCPEIITTSPKVALSATISSYYVTHFTFRSLLSLIARYILNTLFSYSVRFGPILARGMNPGPL